MLNLDKEVYSYEFGIKQINLGYSELNKSMCYISDEIDLGELDKDTYNKALQKIIESNRVGKREKNKIKKMKRR